MDSFRSRLSNPWPINFSVTAAMTSTLTALPGALKALVLLDGSSFNESRHWSLAHSTMIIELAGFKLQLHHRYTK